MSDLAEALGETPAPEAVAEPQEQQPTEEQAQEEQPTESPAEEEPKREDPPMVPLAAMLAERDEVKGLKASVRCFRQNELVQLQVRHRAPKPLGLFLKL